MRLVIGDCPWCGSPGRIVGGRAALPGGGAQWWCDTCGARGPVAATLPEDPALPSQRACEAFWSAFTPSEDDAPTRKSPS